MGKLVSCKTCNEQVDNTAKSCPHCGVAKPGQKAKNRNGQGCLIIVMLAVGLLIWNSGKKKWENYEPLTREQEITQSFSVLTGEHKELKKILVPALKDPDSYKHIKTSYIDKGDYLLVTTQYYAANSFGALDQHTVTVKAMPFGTIIEFVSND